jgi:hypothetical protein
MLQFMDRITTDQAAAASDAMTKFFVSCEIPFAMADHPSFLSFLKTIRPACANHELRPSRRSMANFRLPELHASTKVLLRECLSEWAEFAKAALLVDGWQLLCETRAACPKLSIVTTVNRYIDL